MPYLVKFLPADVMPPYVAPECATVKIGSFMHFRKIEDETRRDSEEGQRGLDLTIRKPSRGLDELIANSKYAPQYPKDQVNADGAFNFEYHILDHAHLYDFNAWIFCCSIIENLSDIETLKTRFNAKHHYFITDLDSLIHKIQRSLAADLQARPFHPSGEPRVIYPKNGNVFLDGHKNVVTYSPEETKYTVLTCDSLEEFFQNHARDLSIDLMCTKSKRFADEKEFRIIFYACEKRGGQIYKTTDDYVILQADLRGIVSSDAIELA